MPSKCAYIREVGVVTWRSWLNDSVETVPLGVLLAQIIDNLADGVVFVRLSHARLTDLAIQSPGEMTFCRKQYCASFIRVTGGNSKLM